MIQPIRSEKTHDLPDGQPSAARTRRDSRRLNGTRNAAIMAGALQTTLARYLAFHIAELGAADGEFLLSVAQRLKGPWRNVEAVLVDSDHLLAEKTRNDFAGINWRVQSAKKDVFQWLAELSPGGADAIIANLFLHQFNDDQLRLLFREAAAKTRVLIAIEPRRSSWAQLASHLLTRKGRGNSSRDGAPDGVQRTFFDRELSVMWPDMENWQLNEGRVGLFNHLFIAQRKEHAHPKPFEMAHAVLDNGTQTGSCADGQPEHESSSLSNRAENLAKPKDV